MKLRELELREKELSLQLKLKELEKSPAVPTSSLSGSAAPFDVSKQIRFVPPFQEKEVDKYFLHFEKVATSLMWPKEVWMVLLQSVLVGKAREVYSAMTVEQSAQYDHVKQAVLKAYELVPEAYRQKFRNRRIQDKQTYTEFARDKEALFDRWCASKEVVKDFEKLRQLILVEEFKSCLPSNIKTYIDEQKVDSLQRAAVLADDYSLTHHGSFATSGGSQNKSTPNDANHRKFHNDDFQATGKGEDFQRGLRRSTPGGPICNYCKRRGHVISECRTLEKRKNNPTGNSVVRTVREGLPPPGPTQEDMSNYHPFVSEGYVSLSKGGEAVAVKILRDTGATQSFIASHVLPLSDQTSVEASVLIQGVGMDVIRVPLHQVHLQSDLISGPVVMGVRPSLPVKGVSLILGNDLAGSKVRSNVHVVNSTQQVLCSPPIADEPSDVFPACVVTRAAARRAQEQETDLPMSQPITLTDRRPDQTQGEQSAVQDVGNQGDGDCSVLDNVDNLSVSRRQLIADQESDQEVNQLAKFAVDEAEADFQAQCFYLVY